MASNIRAYANIKAVKVHLGQIEAAINRSLANLSFLVTAAPVKQNKAVRIGEVQRTPVKKPATTAVGKKVKNVSEELKRLEEQNTILSNMILNLNTSFSTEDVDHSEVENLRDSISKLQSRIKKGLNKLYNESRDLTTDHISDYTDKLASKLTRTFGRRFNTSGEKLYTCGTLDGHPVFTIFVVFENVKNSRGEIHPKIVMALSQTQDEVFFNPGLVNTRLVGNFKLGFKLDKGREDKEIIRLAEEQMRADSHLSAIHPKLMPEGITKQEIQQGSVKTVTMDEKSITVGFSPSIKTEKQAELAAQEVYRILHTALVRYKPRTKDRIAYSIKKRSKDWSATFMITTGDHYTGRTLENDEIEKLKELFSPDEIKVINRALNDQT